MNFSQQEIANEAQRLYKNLANLGWQKSECLKVAPKTLAINHLKKQTETIILAHSYQSPDIMYGVADFIGDSYGLSRLAMKIKAQRIIFSSVHFMGETVKLLNPDKEVLVPAVAGCSLADSITSVDVKNLRKKYPQATFVCYINTSAAVKAECDICCTSANAIKIVNNCPTEQVVFLPDQLMGKNIQKQSDKEVVLWHGKCIVHEIFTPSEIDLAKKLHPDVKVLAHLECDPEVIKKADLAGSTKDMLEYVSNSKADTFMLVTECGITDRVKKENPNKKIVGGCNLCPFMRSINLDGVLTALTNPQPSQVINIDKQIFVRARNTVDKMFEIEKL